MHYHNTLLIACASFTFLVSANPQSDAAAVSGAVLQSTMTQTLVATATIGGMDPAAPTSMAATGASTAGNDSIGNDSIGSSSGGDDSDTGSGSGAGIAAGSGTGASSASTGLSGSVNSAAAAASGTAGAYTSGGTGTGTGAGVGSGTGTGAGMGSGTDSASNTDTSGFPTAKDDLPAGFWEKLGRVADGDRAQFWSKFTAGNGHPHQPVARGWSSWVGKGANKGQGTGMGGSNKQNYARTLLARDVIVSGGPSWSDVRSGDVGAVNVVARSMSDGKGWLEKIHGTKGHDGKGHGEQSRGGHGQ